MLGRHGKRTQVLLACLLTAAMLLVAGPPRAGAQVSGKRAEAIALKERLEDQGRRLSLADEEYNQARIERQRIERQAETATALVETAEQRWGRLRQQLAKRVRLLYMHPGAPIDAYLGAGSVSDLARAHKFGSSVLTADAELVMKTEKARQELLTRAERLDGVKRAARTKEEELADRRSEVDSAMGQQRALLANVTGEVAELIEQERSREVASAEAPTPVTRPSAPSGDDDASDDGGTTPRPAAGNGGSAATPRPAPTAAPPAPEPSGPAPAVKSGASKAVATAAAQIGKPYEWAADGPDSFDCSGLTMYAWASAGVSLPHSSRAQYASLPHVSKDQLQPGDLVFFGSPIHHVGIYEGGGTYINAPTTGEFVRRNTIHRSDWAGAARP